MHTHALLQYLAFGLELDAARQTGLWLRTFASCGRRALLARVRAPPIPAASLMITSRTMRWLKSGASARPGSGFGSLKPGLATASAHLLPCRRAQLLYGPPFVLRRPPPRRLDALGDQLGHGRRRLVLVHTVAPRSTAPRRRPTARPR